MEMMKLGAGLPCIAWRMRICQLSMSFVICRPKYFWIIWMQRGVEEKCIKNRSEHWIELLPTDLNFHQLCFEYTFLLVTHNENAVSSPYVGRSQCLVNGNSYFCFNFRLIEKLMIVVNLIEMARVTGVTVNMLTTRGQQIKVNFTYVGQAGWTPTMFNEKSTMPA